jgi:hypothetical protein
VGSHLFLGEDVRAVVVAPDDVGSADRDDGEGEGVQAAQLMISALVTFSSAFSAVT